MKRKLSNKIFLLAAIVLLFGALQSCGGNAGLVKIEYSDGYFIDKKNGIKYQNAHVAYEPVSVGEEYAAYGNIILHKLPGSDPLQWMTEQYDGIGSVFYSEDVTLPPIEDFDAVKVHVCVSNIQTIGIAAIDDGEIISQMISLLGSGEQREAGPARESFYLKFASDTYPFLYYNLMYVKAENGGNFLYDRGTKRCVEIGSLIDKYLPDGIAEDAFLSE